MKRIEREICESYGLPKYMISEKANHITATEVKASLEALRNYKHPGLIVLEASVEKVMTSLLTRLYNIIWRQRLKEYELKYIPSL